MNALAAIVAARHAGVPVEQSLAALAQFRGVKRRLERIGEARGVTVYDDFAHHPTAIATTVGGLRARRRRAAHHRGARAALEHDEARHDEGRAAGQPARSGSHVLLCARATSAGTRARRSRRSATASNVHDDLDRMVDAIAAFARTGDHVLVMSNGGFGGVHGKILAALAK